jgi:hypothetical protein
METLLTDCRYCRVVRSSVRQHTTVRQMRVPELMWVVGLFEGEGTIAVNRGGSAWQVAVGMTDFDIIDRLYEVVGAGSVHPHLAVARKKPMLYWRLTGKYSLISFLQQIRPYLGIRRGARADEALLWLQTSSTRCVSCTRAYLLGPVTG